MQHLPSRFEVVDADVRLGERRQVVRAFEQIRRQAPNRRLRRIAERRLPDVGTHRVEQRDGAQDVVGDALPSGRPGRYVEARAVSRGQKPLGQRRDAGMQRLVLGVRAVQNGLVHFDDDGARMIRRVRDEQRERVVVGRVPALERQIPAIAAARAQQRDGRFVRLDAVSPQHRVAEEND
jgi:hypothetical protein